MSEFNLEQFVQAADRVRKKAIDENRLTDNPSAAELRLLLEKEPGARKTIYGNFVAESEPTSRSAMFTKNSVDHPFGEEELKLLAQCERALEKERLISIDSVVGKPLPTNSEHLQEIMTKEFHADATMGQFIEDLFNRGAKRGKVDDRISKKKKSTNIPVEDG